MCSFIVRTFSGFSNLSVALHNGGRSFFTASVVVTSAAFSRPATIEKKPVILKWLHSTSIHFGTALGWRIDEITDRPPPMWPRLASRRSSLHAATQPFLASLRNAPLWGGAFRDDMKNDGCIADYSIFRSTLLLVLSLVPIEVFLLVMWLCALYKNQHFQIPIRSRTHGVDTFQRALKNS